MTEPDPTRGDPTAEPVPRPDEEELLAAFDRLRPQGSVRWAFDDAVRRVDQPDIDSSAGALPWEGLPADLWERGRSARIGQRFVGDVARVMGDILAADARAVADAAVAAVNGDRFVATWDAFQYLSARVDALEARVDPLGLELAEWSAPEPDPAEWLPRVGEWFAAADSEAPIVVGESGDGSIVGALRAGGRVVQGVDPRGGPVWRALADTPSGGPEGPGAGTAGGTAGGTVFDHVGHRLRSVPDRTLAGVVLIGCIDRADLAGKVDLLGQAVRVTESGGTVVVLTVDQAWWDASLSPTARDLAGGRPFHPETWEFLLRRLGVPDPVWHRPEDGAVHAVVATVDR